MGVTYLVLYGENTYAKIKPRSSLTNYNKTRRVRSNRKKIYLYPPTSLRYFEASLTVKLEQKYASPRTA